MRQKPYTIQRLPGGDPIALFHVRGLERIVDISPSWIDKKAERRRIKQLLERFYYKPNFQFMFSVEYLGQDPKSPLIVRFAINVHTIDSTSTLHTTTISHNSFLEWRYFESMGDEGFSKFFHGVIVGIEVHEADEFFRFDGKQLRDPHAHDVGRLK